MNILTSVLILLFVIFNIFEYGKGLLVISLIQFFSLFAFSIRNFSKSIVLVFFLVSFFTFYLSKEFFFLLFPNILDEFGLSLIINYDTQIVKLNAIFLSLLFIGIGYVLVLKRFKSYKKSQIVLMESNTILYKMRKILIYVFYITSVFTVFKVMVVGSSVLAGSYGSGTSATVSQSTNLLSFLNTFSYIAYLSTIPTIKQIKKTLPLFIILTIASIALGARGNAVCVLLFVIVYLLSRDFYQNKGNEILSFRIRVTLLILSPIVLIGLSLFAFVRSGNAVESHGIYYDIIGFFIQQGGTGNLISLGNDLKSSLPSQNMSYTFGPLINLIKDYLHLQPSTGDSLLYEATQGNNLGATLTYLTQPNYYFKGGGLGTSYMAELYIDFGYWGIIIYNFILGIILRFISFDVRKNLIGRIICNFIVIGIFFLPRDFALSVSRLLTPAYIICYLGIIYLYALCKYNWPTNLNNLNHKENII